MKQIAILLVVISVFSFTWMGSEVRVITFTELQKQTEKRTDDTLYIINFWATWCKPCVAEIPGFIEVTRKFSTQKVKIIFVSLNSVKELPMVEKFVAAKKIQNNVFVLNGGNPNNWIDNIDASWSGSIPATVVYKNGNKVFFKEGGLTQEGLRKTISTNLSN